MGGRCPNRERAVESARGVTQSSGWKIRHDIRGYAPECDYDHEVHAQDNPEKPLRVTSSATVLKLTQVGEARSLRRSGERWLRNSAN